MSESFSDYLIEVIIKGSLSLMFSIGHGIKLFDIMSVMSPSTIEEISAKSGMNSRFVKEYLAAMVTGKIIDYETLDNTFHLSKEKFYILQGKYR